MLARKVIQGPRSHESVFQKNLVIYWFDANFGYYKNIKASKKVWYNNYARPIVSDI